MGADLGGDIVKTNWTGSAETFKEVVKGCPAPVVIAGGETKGIKEVLDITEQSIAVGGHGVAFGRNIWQSEDPTKLTRAIALIVHKKYSTEEAIKETKIIL
jgi:fructose-bisphosphate aldolase/2-amino-3,7-dideoxy-D-threo-hept-6-ulosonate synthase